MKKKYIIIGIISVLIVLMGVTYSYFTGMIVGEGKKMTVSANKLAIIFTDTSEITNTEIIPGWEISKEFTIENKSNDVFFYDINIDKLINTFVTEGYLQYKITSDNGYNMSEYKNVPKSEEEKRETLANEIRIKKGELQKYKIEFRYLNSEEDQSIDMGKIFKGSMSITKSNIKLKEAILANNPNRKTRDNFDGIIEETYGLDPINGTLYEEKDTRFTEGETVYYFAGDTRNNWVYFGGFYWRIIRINEDGSIRLIYIGDKHDTNEGYIGISTYNGNKEDENTYNNTRYAGYMYGSNSNDLEGNRLNDTNSTIKTEIDKWYEENLLTKYDEYISRTAIYCNDRSDDTYNIDNTFDYASAKRISGKSTASLSKGNKVHPSYKCGVQNDGTLFTDASNKDKFSGINIKALLKYPIALITIDEYIYAGGQFDSGSLGIPSWKLWLNRNCKNTFNNMDRICYDNYYTMSPAIGFNSFASVSFHNISVSGHNGWDSSFSRFAVRPVLSLKSCINWKSGVGTPTNPFEVYVDNTCKTKNN